MKVFRTLAEAAAAFQPAALAIGNFDGAHLGHQALFARVRELAAARNLTPSALTFDPHPLQLLRPEAAPGMLYSLPGRLEWLQHFGIAQVLVLPFTRELAALSPSEFAEQVLADALHTRTISVGADFRFGKGRTGNIEVLRELGKELGFTLEVPLTATWRGQVVSSTSVRNALQSGDPRLARHLLGRPFALTGRIVRGAGIGRKQTVPTLNLQPDNSVLPANGVYITCAKDLASGREWESITNVGTRPTFEGAGVTVESFLLSPYDGMEPAQLRLAFLARVRAERKFSSAEALKEQIFADVAKANRFFRHTRPLAGRYTD